MTRPPKACEWESLTVVVVDRALDAIAINHFDSLPHESWSAVVDPARGRSLVRSLPTSPSNLADRALDAIILAVPCKYTLLGSRQDFDGMMKEMKSNPRRAVTKAFINLRA